MTYLYAAQFGPEDLRAQNATTKLLIAPTSLTVYLAGTSTLAALFTDKTAAVAAGNPLALNVTANTPGVDANGNVMFFAVPGSYDLLVNGTQRYTRQLWPDPFDLAGLSAADVTALKAFVIQTVTDATTLS